MGFEMLARNQMKALIKNEWFQFLLTTVLLAVIFIAVCHVGFFVWEYVLSNKFEIPTETYSFGHVVGLLYFICGIFSLFIVFSAVILIKLISDGIFSHDK